jgi:aminoglycoside phosphotransferase family enzyme/adenylate kinase family enzyme
MPYQFPHTLQNPEIFPHPVSQFELIETHISWVLLTRQYAYKIKKPLNLGFLDYSTLAKRHHFCLEELRLNQRLAPQIYLEVVAITGSPSTPAINGPGAAFEYAVKMREFPQAAQLDRLLQAGKLMLSHIDDLANKLADFHSRIPRATAENHWGEPVQLYQAMKENFSQIHQVGINDKQTLSQLKTWTETEYKRLTPLLRARKQAGFIRECHGDMHLANMALLNNTVVIFDGIEFNPNLRWIDVFSELAFILMDLQDRRKNALATRLLNRYLEITGDYGGLKVLRFYQVYRAMVRAKVTAIRLAQKELSPQQRTELQQVFQTYLNLAKQYTQPSKPMLLITHGVSGSGKSTVAQALLAELEAVCLRSDVERKRLFGIAPHSTAQTNIYTHQATQATYDQLAELAQQLLAAGFTTLIDATFLLHSQRARFQMLAKDLSVPFIILDCQADEKLCQQRIERRQQSNQDVSDATVPVLRQQMQIVEALDPTEQQWTVTVNSGHEIEVSKVIKRLGICN